MSLESPEPASSEHRTDEAQVPRLLRPFVDWVARVPTSVQRKLLIGFFTVAVLMLGIGVLSITVLNRVETQFDTLSNIHAQTDQAREMIYSITAQSHFRAMALATQIDTWNDKLDIAKDGFAEDLAEIRTYAVPPRQEFFDGIQAITVRFDTSGDEVTQLYEAGLLIEALDLHVQAEHEISHELEDELNSLIADSRVLARDQEDAFRADRRLVTIALAGFSAISLLVAVLLGGTLSWSLVRPVRKVDRALQSIADGDFDQRIEVPNRDEFGSLTVNLNHTAGQLAVLYHDLETLNANLQETVEEQVGELERASALRRYISPRLAESIMAGDTAVTLRSSRKYLTVFFSDIRGFTEMTERMEPEELVDELNEYLSEMSELAFQHEGTLDKYTGDAILVFFGDPIPQDDHAERAVRMAFDMRDRVDSLKERWTARYGEPFTIGIGITTGWVTVGNIGSAARSDYTVLGNQVNLASRLADRASAGQILVTERTLLSVQEIALGELVDEVELKGVSRPIKIYDLQPRE
ncbi:MAG: adenylate/guanylate cyclase domain-containing protein [Acidimicrobiia bacterium]